MATKTCMHVLLIYTLEKLYTCLKNVNINEMSIVYKSACRICTYSRYLYKAPLQKNHRQYLLSNLTGNKADTSDHCRELRYIPDHPQPDYVTYISD